MVSVGDAITFMYKSNKYLGVIITKMAGQRLRVKVGGLFVYPEINDIIGFESLTVAEKDNEITLQRDNEITSQRAEKHKAEKHKELASLRAELRATDKEMAMLMSELHADLPEDKEMALLMAELQADLHAKNKELASLRAELQSKKDKDLASLRAEAAEMNQ